jgi:hypothetical protein
MSLTLVSGPAAAPVSLAEVKAQCRYDAADEDALISGYIGRRPRWSRTCPA